MAAEPLFLDSVAKMENYAVQSGFVSVGSTVLSSKIRAHNLLGGQNRSREAKRLTGASYFVKLYRQATELRYELLVYTLHPQLP